jgi:hypothetical protein
MGLNLLHKGNSGDIISALPAIREIFKKMGQKPNLYLYEDHPAIYYDGATHPVKDEDGKDVSLNEYMISMLIPLLRAQPYIGEVKKFEEEVIDVDLSYIRDGYVNMPYSQLQRCYFYLYPDLACDLSKSYIELPETKKDFAIGKIIINRTQRYNNNLINYSFLKEYEDSLLFAGTEFEHMIFCEQFGLDFPRLQISDFLELAQALLQSRFFIGGQSFCYQISEGLKIPRILELCNFAPNCLVIGELAYDFYHQGALEYYVSELAGKKFSIKLM